MALNAYLELEGDIRGPMEGSCTQKGREGKCEIYGWNHVVKSPRDAASGLPTGKRQHGPLEICKPVDKASPHLMAALVANENIPKWVMQCWRPGRSGNEQQHYSIELVNANIASIRQEQLNNKIAENMPIEIREYVAFTYQKIIWRWMDPNIEAEDDWESPVNA